ncbi:MAG TPA: T9SS type A sorting domain-containing protein [Bacteroidales bacterium]|nr:T9SS type A sorting domain-containing protein [Bacteroidales bacterium]HPS62448.1 T9SS type A sorting domain-containing protein [Bacteroidales bacterium]
MKRYLTLLCLLCSGILSAQDYQQICRPGTTFFRATDGYFKAFRRDSVAPAGNNDTLFFSYPAIRDSSHYDFICRDTTNGDALGRKIIKRHDGWFWFFNCKQDTIRIHALASPGTSWRFCSISDCTYLQATLTSIQVDTIQGVPDSVKVISLQTKNQDNQNIPGIFNQKVFRLSKHFGLSDFYDLYLAPSDAARLQLIGQTVPAFGPHILEWAEVYDFDAGDEFHYFGTHVYNTSTVVWKVIKKILDKTSYGDNDSVHYLVEICKKTWYPAPPPNTETIYDTLNESYNFTTLANNPTIGLLPDQFYSPFGSAMRVRCAYSNFNGRQITMIDHGGYEYYLPDSCYNDPFEHGGPEYTYAPGLGITKYSYAFVARGYESHTEQLVYFKKGQELWGSPVAESCSTLLSVEEPERVGHALSVFPNPAASEIRISLPPDLSSEITTPGKYSLTDFSGRKVTGGAVTGNSFVIQRNHLAGGIYLLIVTDSDGRMVGRSKVVFE